jgi:hypothetical protein
VISEGLYMIEVDNVIRLGVLVAQRDDVLASVNLYYQVRLVTFSDFPTGEVKFL